MSDRYLVHVRIRNGRHFEIMQNGEAERFELRNSHEAAKLRRFLGGA